MALHFSKEEFSKRKQDVLKSMKMQNLDALLMFRQESMYWLTGYDTFGYVFFQTLVLTVGYKIGISIRPLNNSNVIECTIRTTTRRKRVHYGIIT